MPLPIAAPAAPWDREGLLFPEGYHNANILASPSNSVLAALIYFMLFSFSFPCTYIDRKIITVKGIRRNGVAHPRVLTERAHTLGYISSTKGPRKREGREIELYSHRQRHLVEVNKELFFLNRSH